MRRISIELIPRINGFFRFRGKLIPSVRKASDGIAVAVFFTPSQLDQDFAEVLGFQPYLWFPSVRELEEINRALNKSDEQTFKMLRTEWEGIRPHKIQNIGDILL